jgi:hypothetical protein
MLFCMGDLVIFIPVVMVLWGLSAFIGWLGVAFICYGLITVAVAGTPPLLCAWLLITSLLAVLGFIIIDNVRCYFLR